MSNESDECSDCSDKCLQPAPAEQFAGAAGTDRCAERNDPVRIAERTLPDARDCTLDRIDRRVAAQDAPRKLVDRGEDCEVDHVLRAFAELCEGTFSVTDAEHEGGICDV